MGGQGSGRRSWNAEAGPGVVTTQTRTTESRLAVPLEIAEVNAVQIKLTALLNAMGQMDLEGFVAACKSVPGVEFLTIFKVLPGGRFVKKGDVAIGEVEAATCEQLIVDRWKSGRYAVSPKMRGRWLRRSMIYAVGDETEVGAFEPEPGDDDDVVARQLQQTIKRVQNIETLRALKSLSGTAATEEGGEDMKPTEMITMVTGIAQAMRPPPVEDGASRATLDVLRELLTMERARSDKLLELLESRRDKPGSDVMVPLLEKLIGSPDALDALRRFTQGETPESPSALGQFLTGVIPILQQIAPTLVQAVTAQLAKVTVAPVAALPAAVPVTGAPAVSSTAPSPEEEVTPPMAWKLTEETRMAADNMWRWMQEGKVANAVATFRSSFPVVWQELDLTVDPEVYEPILLALYGARVKDPSGRALGLALIKEAQQALLREDEAAAREEPPQSERRGLFEE